MEKKREAGGRILMFLMGGVAYFCLELAWSGDCRPAMIPIGGLCFMLVGRLHQASRAPLFVQALWGMGIVTGVEFLSGCLCNVVLRMNLWDYTSMRLNVLGQICPFYSAIWLVLFFPLIWAYDRLEHSLFRKNR